VRTRNRVDYLVGARNPQERSNFGVVLPLKCIILCMRQTPQQHDTADLSVEAARHGESEASEWTHPPRECQERKHRCGRSSTFFDHLSSFAVALHVCVCVCVRACVRACVCVLQLYLFSVVRGPFREEFYQCVTHGKFHYHRRRD